jgi:hypothetical protein
MNACGMIRNFLKSMRSDMIYKPSKRRLGVLLSCLIALRIFYYKHL